MVSWKPGDPAPGMGSLKQDRAADSFNFHWNPHNNLPIYDQRKKLPIFQLRNHILYLLEKYQVLVVVGETGCGKSSQIPQYLLEAGWTSPPERQVAITQPRRVAAVSLAARVAEERNSILGREIGYSIRFDDCSSDQTRVKFLTDGLLVREMMGDPMLERYSVVMLDEAHERSLYTDIAAGLVKKILKKRSDLRVIVSSATLDAVKMRDYFDVRRNKSEEPNATILSIEGRVFPVEVLYSKNPVPDYVAATVDTVLMIHEKNQPGDILAFLTGQEEVEECTRNLKNRFSEASDKFKYKLHPLPMYANLPAREQLKVFQRAPVGTRKVILSTNIAETSITIDNIVHIIDCGFVKFTVYNPVFNTETLSILPVSQASANQRAGRAGRVCPGKCYRLYSEEEFDKLQPQTLPELQRCCMAFPVLQLKALGVANVAKFDYMSPPPAKNLAKALELLYSLGAIDGHVNLTNPIGHQMAELPITPMFSKSLLRAVEFGCSEEILTLCALMQVKSIFHSPFSGKAKMSAHRAQYEFFVKEGDHMTSLNVFKTFVNNNKSRAWCEKYYINYSSLTRAFHIREQLLKYARRYGIEMTSARGFDDDRILKCLVSGFFPNIALYHPSGVYRSVRDVGGTLPALHVHPDSVLYTQKAAPCVLFTETVHSSKMYMREISVVNPDWLLEVAPHYYTSGT